MAVYTSLDDDALAAWLADHAVGTLVSCTGIAAGIENSNFFVTTRDALEERHFVLTLFERLSIDELPFYLTLMKHLAERGVPCPQPMPGRDGALCSVLAGKPAALVTRLAGRSITAPTPTQCGAMGRELARMHAAATSFERPLPNPRGFDWWLEAAARVREHLDDDRRALLDGEIAWITADWAKLVAKLPRGAIHADVFRDNVLFVEDHDDGHDEAPEVGGIIDFYFAGDDAFVLDLAICLNDWCVDRPTGTFVDDLLDAFVAAYEEVRPLRAAETASLPAMLRAGALRFWLSRLDDLHRPRPAQLLTPHDPAHFERILRRRRDEAADGVVRFARIGA